MKHKLHKLVDDTLEKFGGLYTFDDIVAAVRVGKMQSFANGDSWMVTQVAEFPQKRVLDIVFAVGNTDELSEIESEVIGFARSHGIEFMMANARPGFDKVKSDGWTKVSATFVKDIGDGT